MELDARIIITNDPDIATAEELIDVSGIDYDWDGAGRLMVASDDVAEVETLLDGAGIDFELV